MGDVECTSFLGGAKIFIYMLSILPGHLLGFGSSEAKVIPSSPLALKFIYFPPAGFVSTEVVGSFFAVSKL